MAPGISQRKAKLTIAMAVCAAFLTSAITAATVAENSPEDYVELHNAARAAADAGPVSWDGDAARRAAVRAAACCARRTAGLQSRPAAGAGVVSYGENVFRGTPGKAWAAADAMRAWTAPAAGAGVVSYGENVFRGTPGKAWAAADAMRAWTAPAATEYAQVVWPGSNRIGCARAVCAGERGVVISCSYKPAVKEELKAALLPSYCRYNISRCIDCPIC